MLTCEICGKADIKTGQGMAGHKQFAHKQLSSGEPARSSATLATEDLVFEQVTALESELQEEFQEQLKQLGRQLERRTMQLGSKAELSDSTQRFEQAFNERDAKLTQLEARVDFVERGLRAVVDLINDRVEPILEMHEFEVMVVVSGVEISDLKRKHT